MALHCHKIYYSTLIFVLIIINFNFPLTTAEEKCRSGCRTTNAGGESIFKYTDGTTYSYNFDSKIDVLLSSAEGQKTSTEIKCTILLTQQSECNQILRIKNLQIIGNDGKKNPGTIENIDKPVRLNFHDGHIEDMICITPGDTQHSLNIKRAIASIFQINLKNGYETDVFGLCPTDVNHFEESGNILNIQKRRNLNKCAYRESIKHGFFSTTFNLNSEIRSSPLLNSDYSGKFKIKNGILDNAHITEHYLYMPFSVGDKGAKSIVETKVELVGTSKDNPQTKCSQLKSIIFDDPHPVKSPKTNPTQILNVVKEVTKTIGTTVGSKTAKEFINLIKIIRVSNKDDLLAVYNQVRAGVGFSDKQTAKKVFLDALLHAGNADTIEVAIELLKNKELNKIEEKLVYLGLSTIRHTSESSVNTLITLLNQQNLPREAYLGIGAFVGRHCQQHTCKNVDGVNKLIGKLIGKLGDGKATNKQTENEIIYILKGLKNINYLTDNAIQKIIGIAQDKKSSNRLRVAALDTYLSDPCKDKLRDSALGILKDIQQDSEVRIKAYLALVQCPNGKITNAIKNLITNEPSYQVGGFIVSHIKSLRNSANNDKILQKEHLGSINIPNKYPTDFRKYSFNNEFSYSVDTLGMGNSIETNVIYSQQSFLPRSQHFNLTSQLFGHTINFLEIDVRQENVDKLLEYYFGPKGVIRSHTLQELWDSKGKHATDMIKDLKERINKSLRSRRDLTKSDIDQIGKQVQIKTNELNKDFDFDLSIKSFGTEFLFLNINDDIKKYTPEVLIDKILNSINKGLDDLKDFDKTFKSNLLLIDAELSYPTSAGFPIKLAVEASSNIQIKSSGQIDLRSLFQKDSKAKLSLIPSVNILVSGRLTFDTLLIENGLKINSNLYTATGGEITFEIFNNKHGIDVKVNLPLEKQDLITFTRDIYFHTREWGAPEHNVPLKFEQNKDFSICLDHLNPLIGLTFCGEINGPNLAGKHTPILPYPLAGDSKISITVEKEDMSELHFKFINFDSSDKFGIEMNLESFNKKMEKKVSVELEAFLMPDKVVRLVLSSPMKKAEMEGRIISNNNEKSLQAKFSHDNMEYFGKVGIDVSGNDERSVYKPIFQYKTPQDQTIQTSPNHIEGQVIVEKSNDKIKYIFDNVKLVIQNQKNILFNGNIGKENKMYFNDLTVSDGTNSVILKGQFQIQPNYLNIQEQFENTFNPNTNFNIKGELKKSPNELDGNLQVIHGADLNSKTNILSIVSHNKYLRKNDNDKYISIKQKFSYPLMGINAKYEYEHQPKKIQNKVDIQYNEHKIGTDLELEFNQKTVGDYDLEFSVWGLGQKLKIDSERQIIDGDESKIDNTLELNDLKIKVDGKVKHHIKPQDIDVGSDLTITTTKSDTPIKVNNGFKYNPNEIDLYHKVTTPNKNYVDLLLKANKNGNVNGAIKINFKHLHVMGQIKAVKGKGDGDILIQFPTLKKELKGDTTFTIHEPNYNVIVNIYPLYHDDKNKKITISTENLITMEKIQTKNLIDLFGHKLQINGKGTRHGDFKNGKLHGELEIIPSNNNYISGKIEREMSYKDGVFNGHGKISLEYRDNKEKPGAMFSLNAIAKNTSPRNNLMDLEYNLIVNDGQGHNIMTDIWINGKPQPDGKEITIKSKIYGNILKHPLETEYNGIMKGKEYNCQIKCNYGSNFGLDINTNVDLVGNNKPIKGDYSMELKTPSKLLKKIKITASGSIHKGIDHIDLKGATSILAESPEKIFLDIDSNGEIHVTSDKEGKIKGSFKSNNVDPISIDISYKCQHDEKNKKLNSIVDISYGKDKNIKGDFNFIKLPGHEYKLDVNLNLPTKEHSSNQFHLHTKRSDDIKSIQSDIEIISDGKKWTLNNNFEFSSTNKMIDIIGKCPKGKIVQIYGKINEISDKQLKSAIKLINQHKDFLLEFDLDANVENIDNFQIKANINCPKLKLDKIYFEAHNKPSKNGRKIHINAKSDKENLLSGSTSYQAREEKGKLIIEGSGSFKVKEETKSANFKYIRQNLEIEKNGENGLEISFDAGLGNKAIDAEFKITNKQFRILQSYCEEKKQCAHIEIDSKIYLDDNFGFNHELEIAIDLRKLGLSHEFGLKSVTTRKEYLLDHTVDIHFQSKENSKYQYTLYMHPKKTGVSLTTPKRILSLEAQGNMPKNFKEKGKFTVEIVFYLDKKNQPNKKTLLVGSLSIDPSNHIFEGEAKLSSVGLSRPLTVTYKSNIELGNQKSSEEVLELDIFAKPNQKLIITNKYVVNWSNNEKIQSNQHYHIKSEGLNINIKCDDSIIISKTDKSIKSSSTIDYNVKDSKYSSAYIWEISPKNIKILLKVLNVELFQLLSEMDLTKDLQKIHTDINIYGVEPYFSHFELKHFNTLKYQIGHKNKPNNKLQIHSGFIPGQIADLRVEILKDGTTLELLHGTIKLDDANFLKSDYGLNSKNFQQHLVKHIQQDTNNFFNNVKMLTSTMTDSTGKEMKHLLGIMKESQPDLGPMRKYYTDEMVKIKNEILADKTIREISELLDNIIVALIYNIENIMNQINHTIENIVKTLHESCDKIFQSINQELIPQLKEITQQIYQTISHILGKFTDVMLTYFVKISEILEKYQPELKKITTSVGEITQDIGRFIMKAYQRLSNIFLEQYHKLYDEIKALPIFEEIKHQYQNFIENGLPNSEVLVNTLKDLSQTIKDVAPNDEIKRLIELIGDYLEKKLTKQSVDDMDVLKKIIELMWTISKNLTNVVIFEYGTDFHKFMPMQIPLNIISKLPKLIAIKFSPLSYLLNENHLEWIHFGLSLVNRPRNYMVPFPLVAIFTDGGHIFTFDGKHLTFPGKCDYLLARDAVNGNFSLAANYDNGNLNSITISDKSGNVITLKRDGKVFLNNQPIELPARKPTIAILKQYEIYHVISNYGFDMICGDDMSGCMVTLSGFYHGQVRGILGNGNNEPYDDFTQANGKIITSESDFGNSFKMNKACPDIKTVDHHDHHEQSHPTCDKLFGWESELRYCYPFVKTDNFKIACVHGMTAGTKNIDETIAASYVAACLNHGIPIRMPAQYIKCKNSDQPHDYGDKFSVKTNGKSADIILMVDTIKSNEPIYKELLQPLIQQLNTELNGKGISDTNYHLIAYGGENQWPSHVTVDGNMIFKSKAPNLKFTDAPESAHPYSLVTGCSIVDNALSFIHSIVHDIKLALGLNLQAKTYDEGLNYPFRAEAIKATIALVSHPCETGRLLPIQILRTLLYRRKIVNINLITPINDLKYKDKPNKDIIGFNLNQIFSLKKKPIENSYKDLNFNDFCVSYTINNNGNVFVTNNFQQTKGPTRKQFIQTTTQAIVDQLTTMEYGLDCECKYSSLWNGSNDCHVVHTSKK